MALKVYNTLTRKKEIFKPIRDKKVGLYTCGPTVYDYDHIGHAWNYVASDVLRRVLEYDGYKVKHVMNITDVGHLTSDADTGEEKMELAAKREKKSAWELAEFYTKIFMKNREKLNMLEPNIVCKATDHIKEMVALIKKLEKKGYTYKISDGIYFSISKYPKYGQLSGNTPEQLKAGARVEINPEKIDPNDFALWKFSPKDRKREMEWDSPWGKGFPGWHIECSAMSMKYLGETIDIHTGGEDHISIHHTNEIAQSESATGKKFVNYWLHGAFLTSKGEKVSKSKGGLYTISELEKQNFLALSYRYLCLTAHYKTQLEFSLETLENAQNSYKRLKNIISEIKNDKKTNEKYLKEFEKAINNDLDMPKALQILWKLIRDEKAVGKINTIKKIDSVFGLDLLKKEEIKIPAEIKKLVDEREKARKNKDWKKADEIRDKIKELGYMISDTNEGPKITKLL